VRTTTFDATLWLPPPRTEGERVVTRGGRPHQPNPLREWMFRFIVTTSAKSPVCSGCAIVLVAYGSFLLPYPRRCFPDFIDQMSTSDGAEGSRPGGRAARHIPIETAMNGMPGVIRVRSVSGIGLSVCTLNSTGRRYLSRPPARVRASRPRPRAAATRRQPADGPVTSIMGEIMLIA